MNFTNGLNIVEVIKSFVPFRTEYYWWFIHETNSSIPNLWKSSLLVSINISKHEIGCVLRRIAICLWQTKGTSKTQQQDNSVWVVEVALGRAKHNNLHYDIKIIIAENSPALHLIFLISTQKRIQELRSVIRVDNEFCNWDTGISFFFRLSPL